EIDARAGEHGDRRGYVALASAHGDRPNLALSASWNRSDGADLYFPELSSYAGGGFSRRSDGEHGESLLGQLGWRDMRLAVKVNERIKTIPTGASGTVLGDPGTRTSDGHDFVEWSSGLRPGAGLELETRVYWDGTRYWGDYVYPGASGPFLNRD